ncbi:MAG: HIT family protein [Mycobacteriaceae bacterium]
MGCLFCNIISGNAPSIQVYEDETVFGFLDIRPIRRGHTLLVPKQHSTNLSDLPPEQGAKLFQAGHKVALALRLSPLGSDGTNLVINDGKAAFQTVFHTHLHVIPRQHGDRLDFAKGFLFRNDPNLSSTGDLVRKGLQCINSQAEWNLPQ